MEYKLEDIVDIPLLQELQDKLNRIYSFPSAIIDNDGKILTAVAWQDICTKFHRMNPQSEKECIKSDQYIIEHLHEANPAASYQCPHGMIDNATPIIIDGKHLGNFFTGQFFLEKPDIDFFKNQAKLFGFDEKYYLEAVEKVPVWTKEKLHQYLDFIKGFIEVIAGIGLKNLKEIESKAELTRINKELSESQVTATKLNEEAIAAMNASEMANKKLREEIIERKRAEEQLKQSHELLTNLACLVPGVIYQYRLYPDGRSDFPYASPGINDIYEVTPEEVQQDATPVFGRLHPEDFDHVSNSIQESARTLNTFFCEFRVVLPRQGLRWRWSQAQPERTADGGTLWYGIISDITERKETEEKIKRTQILLESSIESPKDMIILSIDKQYRYLTFNTFHKNVMFKAYGIHVEIGMNLLDCITNDDDRIKAKINYDKALAGDSHITIQEFGDIERYYYETRYNPILNEKNEIIGATAFSANVTERKLSEVALKESEEKFRKAFLTSPDSIIITRASDGMLISVNEGFLKITGFSEEEVINKSSLKLDIWVNPEDRQNIVNTLKTGKMVTNFEARFRKKNGNIFYGLMSASIINLNGIPYILNITRDITERKQAEQALIVSEVRYRRLFEAAQDGILILDAETGMIMDVNPFLIKLLGYSYEQFLGKAIWEIGFIKDIVANQFNFLELQQKDYIRFENLPLENADGRKMEVEFISNAYQVNNQKVIQCNIRDITDRKLAEEALRESDERLHFAMETSQTGVWDLDLVDHSAFRTIEHDRIFGYADLLPQWTFEMFLEHVIPEDREMVVHKFQRAIETHTDWNFECSINRIDGEVRWIWAAGHHRTNVNGSSNRMAGIVQDITERKQAEEYLKKNNKKLEETLIQLKETQKQILQQEKLRSLGQMTSGICHDINNALTPIMGYTDLLCDDEEVMINHAEELNKIVKSTKNIARTIARLREFYKIRQTEKNLPEKNINKIILSTIELTSHRWKNIAESTGALISIKKELQKDLPLTQIDEGELIEALTNLILNACDAMPDGGELTFITYQKEDNIIIEIKDIGKGMDAETLEHCMDPFFTTKGDKGTGLGLSMVFGVIDRHKGRIEMASEKNKGTSVRLILPINMAKIEEKIIDKIAPFTETLKILSVEDDETIRGMLKQMLMKRKHKVEISSNGKSGLELYKRELKNSKPFDLVITDLGMAEMDGVSLSIIIKELTPDIPIILLTGWGTLINKEDYPSIDYLLKKPITMEDLYRAINELFGEK